MEYELLDTDAERKTLLTEEAKKAELRAVTAELDARQVEIGDELSPGMPGSKLRMSEAKAEAAKYRKAANKLHAMAGTKPDDFSAEVRDQLRNQQYSMETAHLKESQVVGNPEAFPDENVRERKYALTLLEAGIKAIREIRPEEE